MWRIKKKVIARSHYTFNFNLAKLLANFGLDIIDADLRVGAEVVLRG